jgi:hypothetical protein
VVSRLENELRGALNKIQADEVLKIRTAQYLSVTMNERSQVGLRPPLRLAALCSCVLLFILLGSFSYNFYFTPVAYVDLDINPSIGLTINRYDRVIETSGYNEEGAHVLNEAKIRFKTCNDAMEILLDELISEGYLIRNSHILMTLQAGGNNKESDMLENLNELLASTLTGHHDKVVTELFTVTGDVRISAHQNKVTPAKYLAISELQALDPAITFEVCAESSVAEIKEHIRSHGGNHHMEDKTQSSGDDDKAPNVHDNKSSPSEHSNKYSDNQRGGHHGVGNERNHH